MTAGVLAVVLFFAGTAKAEPPAAPVENKEKAAVSASTALNAAEVKKKLGQAVADLKKKNLKELGGLKNVVKSSSGVESEKVVQAKKRGYQAAVTALKEIQKKGIERLKRRSSETKETGKDEAKQLASEARPAGTPPVSPAK
jgi:hypothetical protein